MKIAIFIARENSKRIKNKNIKLFNGIPIIKKTFELVNSFNIFDKIFLSTDSQKIINVCSGLKFDEIIKRPKKLGQNSVTTNQVINHSIDILKKKFDFKYVCCIYPCSLLLEKKNLLNSFKLLKSNKDFVFPILPYQEPIEQALKISNQNRIKYVFPKYSKKNTQYFKKNIMMRGNFIYQLLMGGMQKIKD
tara:strand:+ start:20 stop:592 length:573 start_codon:yes stop_codon:yes gene_type:complete